MSKPYILKKGDTLAKVAEAHLGSRKLAQALADYNGLAGLKDIVVGQAIHLPAKAERTPKPAATAARRTRGVAEKPWPAAPAGLPAIIETFGDIRQYARDDGTADPQWETQFIARANLPFAIPLDWDPSKSATGMRCHKRLAPLLEAVFADIAAKGLQGAVKTYGGCYNWRMKRGQAKPSTHSWGIAIDLNARTNAMGTVGNMDPGLVTLFEGYGFVWGGRWAGVYKDPMHFQYCSGY